MNHLLDRVQDLYRTNNMHEHIYHREKDPVMSHSHERFNVLGPLINICTPRVYGHGDDEKRACYIHKLHRCTVVSIGSNNQWTFEMNVFRRTQCVIHVYDCTVPLGTEPPNEIKSRTIFHRSCIGPKDEDTEIGNFISWDTIVKQIGVVHLLKLDVEGFEYDVLRAMLQNPSHLPVQIAMELHYQTRFKELFFYGRFVTAAEIALHAQLWYGAGYSLVTRNDNNACKHCTEILLVRKTKCSKMCRSCMPRLASDSQRVLIYRPHLHNGLGNRMSGIRGAYRMAVRTRRSFWLDWPARQTESEFFHMQRTASHVSHYMPWNHSSCAPTFFDVRPNMNDFIFNVSLSNENVIVFEEMYHDLGFGANANAAYLSLLRPTSSFLKKMRAHFAEIGLNTTTGWIGLQIRQNEHHRVTPGDHLRIWKSINCAKRIAKKMHSDIFATTNSPDVLRILRSTDLKYGQDESFMRHSSSRVGYLPALLEFATLASSRFVIGTAGSTFSREAANFGGISSVMMDHGYRISSRTQIDRSCTYSPPYGTNVFSFS